MKLVIAEKPSVAKSIAAVIGANIARDGYMEGGGYLVSWCVGHLIELAEPQLYADKYEKWNLSDLPILPEQWKYCVKNETRKQYDLVKRLMNESAVTSVVCATDAGREGELIFRLVYNMSGCIKPIERLWISSMEDSAIREEFKHLRPGNEYNSLFQAALCRMWADWLIGINGTRAMSCCYNQRLIVGRVFSVVLAMIVALEHQINHFVPEKFYRVRLQAGGIDALSDKFTSAEEAGKAASGCHGKSAMVSRVSCEKKSIAPPKLFDLTSLQREANRLYGFTAKQTLDYTQNLYEAKLCTYPRTDSQYLSDDMEETSVQVYRHLQQVMAFGSSSAVSPNVKPLLNSRKVSDHHAIIPTCQVSNAAIDKLSDGERKILLLLSMRVLSAFGEKYEYIATKLELTCNDTIFSATGKTVTAPGWKKVEEAFRQSVRAGKQPEEKEEKILPQVSEGQELYGAEANVEEGLTTPPKRYTEDSLLLAMEHAGNKEMDDEVERKGIGTPATRAEIIEKLVGGRFVERQKKTLVPTQLGIQLVELLPDFIKSVELTVEMENDLVLVSKGQKLPEQFMENIRETVKKLVSFLQKTKCENMENGTGFAAPIQEVLGNCPSCNGPVLKGKYGAYCQKKCGMMLQKAMGKTLTDNQIKNLLMGKKTLVKGLTGKKGSYDAYLIPKGIKDFSYQKDGKSINGKQFEFDMEFPKKK